MKATPGSAVAPRPLLWVLVCLILALALPACFGGDDEQRKPAGALGAGLSYLRSDSSVAFVVATDLDDGALSRLESRRSRSDGRNALEAVLRSGLGQRGISFDSVIRPQLGNPFVAGITSGGDRVAAIRVRDAVRLRRDVEERLDQGKAERLDDYESALVWKEKRPREEAATYAAVHDSELVLAQSEDDLEEAIDASSGSENLAFNPPFRATLAHLGPDALVRAVGDAQRLLQSGDPGQAVDAGRVRWIKALGVFTLDVVAEGRGLSVDFRLGTNRVKLTERDLPLVPGAASPRLHDANAPASAAVLEPRQLAHFLERMLQATDPGRFQRFETGVEQLRAILRVNLRRDLIDRITSLSLAATSATSFTFVGRLEPGTAARFRADLDRAQLFVQGVLGDVLPGASVDARGTGAATRLDCPQPGPGGRPLRGSWRRAGRLGRVGSAAASRAGQAPARRNRLTGAEWRPGQDRGPVRFPARGPRPGVRRGLEAWRPDARCPHQHSRGRCERGH